MSRYDKNIKIHADCMRYMEAKQALEQATQTLVETAKRELCREHGVEIGKSIIKLDKGKGLIVDLTFEQGKYPTNGQDFFHFIWVCQLVKKDGELSNVKRYFSCENLVYLAE